MFKLQNPLHFGRSLSVLLSAAAVSALLCEPATVADAEALRNPFHSSAAAAQGNAFSAQADDASAIFYNPAGITQIKGIQIDFGAAFVNVHTHFESPTGATTHNDLQGPFGMPPPGHLYLAATPRDFGAPWLGDLSLGVGVQSLFSFGSRYPANSPLNTVVTFAKLPLLDIVPTIAYRFTDWVALSAGADIFTFWPGLLGRAEQKFISPGVLGIPPGAHVQITGTGTTAAPHASALFTLMRAANGAPRLNLGFVWRGQSDLPLQGDLRINKIRVAGADWGLHFPDSYTTGVAFWPRRDSEREWKVETDIDYVRWSTLRSIDFRFSNGVRLHNPQDWRDTVGVGVGTEYKWLRVPLLPAWDIALRAGYLYSMTPVPDKNFNPAFSDANGHVLSTGIGLTCRSGGKFLGLFNCGKPEAAAAERKFIGLDFAYQLFLYEPRAVNGNAFPPVNGKYTTVNHTLALTFRVNY